MPAQFDIDPHLRSIVSPELYPDEKLLWVGKPTPIRVVMQYVVQIASSALVFVLPGIVWLMCLFTVFASSRFIPTTQIPVLSLIFIPIAGLFISVAYIYWRATQIVYAMTNRRALIIKPTIDGLDVLAYNIIPYIERRSLANSKGDLFFATETYNRVVTTNFQRRAIHNTIGIRKIGFLGIDNAREVEQLMFKTFVRRRNFDFDDLLDE